MLRSNLFDIEVYSPQEFPLPEEAKHPICSITIYDSYTGRYYSIIIDPSRAGQKETIGNWDIYYVKDERQLIILSVKLIRFFIPDIIGGWYSDSFDVPYFFNRCNNLEMKNILNSISPLNYVNIKGKSISGINITDLITIDKKLKKRTSYTLENVAIEENLPVKKLEKHEDIMEIYRTDKTRFIRYNKGDVEVLVELDKKNKIISFIESTRTFAGLNEFNEAMQNAIIIDTIALRKAFKEGIILPSKPEHVDVEKDDDEDDEDEMGGGLVREPTPGIHRNVPVLDMSKFYPTIMDLLNLSGEMIVVSNLSKADIDVSTGDIYVEYEEGKYARISTKKKGFIPSLLAEFIAERSAIEKEMKKYEINSPEHTLLTQKRDVVKFTLNAVFGVNGYIRFRLYNPIIANAVTFTGRKMISWTADRFGQLTIPVIYGDTDSVHLEIIYNVTIEELVGLGKKYSEQLSHEYIDVVEKEYNIKCNKAFEIEFEKAFKTIIYISKDNGKPAKKRYGARCVWEKGKYVDYLYVRGFDMRRSDASKFCKDIQENVLKLILWDHSKEEIIKYVQGMINGFKTASIEDISIPKGINKNIEQYGKINKNGKKGSIPAQIKGAKYSNIHLHTNLGTGSKVKYLYVKKMPPGFPDTDVISFDDVNKLPKGIVVDYEKMSEANIKKKIVRILQAANINWNDIQGQKSLFSF